MMIRLLMTTTNNRLKVMMLFRLLDHLIRKFMFNVMNEIVRTILEDYIKE